MGSVWKRLQRVNKRAAKFQFTSSYHELRLETTAKWRPSNLSVVWTRRSRRVISAPLPWEPDMVNPLVGHISWPVPDNHAISVTLFKDPRTHELEDKDWTFVIEDITPLGKKRVLASASINMRKYASIESTQQSFTLSLKPVSRKITAAELELTISCVFLREGKATDEDMQSVVSLMSVNNNCDVAPLDDLEDIPDLESSGDISDHLFDFTQQLEQMTTSLNGCMDLPTPLSEKQFSFETSDELLKTPSALPPPQREQQRDIVADSQEHDKTKVPALTPAKSSTSTTTTTTAFASDANTLRSKFVTSTPIAVKPLMTTAQQRKTSDENEHVRRALNFKGATDAPNKQNGEVVNKLPELGGSDADTVKTIKISSAAEETAVKTTTLQDNKSITLSSLLSGTAGTPIKTATTTTTTISTTPANKEDQSELSSAVVSDAIINNSIRTPPTKPARNDSKRAELQPLNLKKSYDHESNSNSISSNNSTAAPLNNISNNNLLQSNGSIKPVEKIILKENTPGQDLLEWCKDVTKEFPNVKVTNLTTSWRNGMAFCAIIQHFEPDLIDMSKLSAHDVVGNCRIAFDAAESLGIPRVIEPRDMSLLAVPDKLAVMTYLHQLRAHFTGKQLQIEQIGPTSDESSYVIGNYKSDNLSQNLLNLSHLKAQLLHQNSLDDDIFGIDANNKSQLSPTAKKDVKNLILSGSKNILGKVLSPTKDKNTINASQHTSTAGGQTLSHATDAETSVGTADNVIGGTAAAEQKAAREETQQVAPQSPTTLDPNTANRILSRHKEMSEKAKQMIEKLKISNGVERNEIDEERQQRLREQARRLILETRTKLVNGSNQDSSPTSPTRLKRLNFSPDRTISPIPNGIEDYGVIAGSGGSGSISPKLLLSPAKKITPPRDVETNSNKLSPSHRLSERFNGTSNSNSSPLQSFNAVMERISPKNEKKGDKLSYIESELEALEREQEAIDQKASSLEKKLRAVMGGNPSNNRIQRNPFLRLIRNSIGGGDSIRIKLLDMDSDGQFSLPHSGETSPTTTDGSASPASSSLSSDEEVVYDAVGVQTRRRHRHRRRRRCTGADASAVHTRPRPRSQSCIVDANENHHTRRSSNFISTFAPLNFMFSSSNTTTATTTASSNHSSCDNLPKVQLNHDDVGADDDVATRTRERHQHRGQRRQQQRAHRESQHKKRSRSRSHCGVGDGEVGDGGETDETEEQLLSQWFTLVNKKNALLRRQMQLNILEQESDLERKYTLLNQELRAAQSVEDWRKTEAQREKERLLLEELVSIVDKRDQLVQHLHNQEIAIEDDHEIARELEQVDISGGKEKCVIQ